ncbi:hypothetical protein SDC9_160572 [bioreactor metagenome]|uniref:Uncharacterized protein n=1 Tax=bioreactor metagenome TaxID=1076179 RepID=A0A645FFV8_9ZZZZ
MLAAEIVRHLAGVFTVDGVVPHADGERLDRVRQVLIGAGADQRTVQSAAEQKADRHVRVQTLDNAERQFFADVAADRVQIVLGIIGNVSQAGVLNELAVLPVVSRREGIYGFH